MARPILIRLPISHYCKKVEWAMSHAGVPYEARNVWFRTLIDFRHVNPENTVPVLEVDGQLICGSHAILQWLDRVAPAAGLYPDGAAAHEAWADAHLGPLARHVAYRTAYAHPTHFTCNPLIWLTARLGRSVILAILKAYKVRRFEAQDAREGPRLLTRAAQRLHDQPFLFGETPSAADFAQAALLEPILRVRKHPLRDHPDWALLEDHVRRVRPPRTLRRRTRRASKADHARWTDLPKVH